MKGIICQMWSSVNSSHMELVSLSYNLGNSMVSMMLASLLHSFHWSLHLGSHVKTFNMSKVFAVTSCMENPLSLVAKPRSSETPLH